MKRAIIKNNIILSILFSSILFLLFLIPLVPAPTLVTANITIQTPASGGFFNQAGGNSTFNITLNFTGENWSRANVTIYSAGKTANTTQTIYVSALANTSVSGQEFNGTINTSILEDGNDYVFNVTVFNGTNTVGQTRTGITIDNSEPEAATSQTPTDKTVNTDRIVNFTGTVNDSTTTSCTLVFVGKNPGSPTYTMTYNANSCSHRLTSIPEQSYTWYVRPSDDSNTTDSSAQTVTVNVKTGAGGSMTPEQVAAATAQREAQALAYASTGDSSDKDDKGWFTPFNIIIGLVIAGFGYVIYQRIQKPASTF